ncbi:MAG: NUDIX domain-containing protein [candidate division Zixibacteria bacterium]|nr:NUDIX domain-containing protein [candidate division Zixibacteria bacterium]
MNNNSNIPIESPGVNVAVIKQDDDGWKFLLLCRSEQETYAGTWGFMTGGKKSDETVADVVLREMKEETGLAPLRMFATEYVIHFYEPQYDKIWILPLIVAEVPSDCEITLSPENCDFAWLKPHRARHRVNWKNLMTAIDNIIEELEVYPAHNWVEIKAETTGGR